MIHPRGDERGQTAVEYAGLLAVLALVFAVLYAVDLPQKLRDGVQAAICTIEGDGGCGGANATTRAGTPGDADGDGLSDRRERRLGTSIRDDDTDGDGISDGVELRRKLNPRSRDTDRDGIQDAREIRIGPDGRSTGADPTKADTDGDGLPDGAELALGTGIGLADGDKGLDYTGDGLSDYEEVYRYGTDPTRTDTDGDGTDDGKEVEAGTNPLVDERALGDKLGPEIAGLFLDDPFGLGKGGALKKLGKGLEKLGGKLGIRFGKKAEEAVTETADNVEAARKRREAAERAAAQAQKAAPGRFEQAAEAMSERAARYQSQVTGTPPGQVYRVGDVKFDGFKDGVLLDAKGPGYANLVKNGEFRPGFKVRSSLADQARRQVNAAGGAPIVWRVAEPEALKAMKAMLREEGITGIKLEHVAPNG